MTVEYLNVPNKVHTPEKKFKYKAHKLLKRISLKRIDLRKRMHFLGASGGFKKKDPGGKRSEGPILGGNEEVVY